MNRKLVLMLALMLLVGMSSVAVNVQPAKAEPITIIVPDDYPTIQAAINAVNVGDTVFVEAGIYYENVVATKNVSLVGEDPSTTVIDGGGTGNVVDITANNVSIQKFTIRKGHVPWNGGINIKNYNGAFLKNNKIIENRFGVILENSSNNEFSGNNFADNEYGIIAEGSSNNIISGNDFANNKYGALQFGDQMNSNVISGNIITGSTYPIYLGNSSNNVISGNTLSNNSRGVWWLGGSYNVVSKNNMTASGPVVEGGVTEGIRQVASSHNIISGNYILDYGYGIELEDSSNCTISENIMNGSTYNFGVFGSMLSDFTHSIDVSNLVDGKRVYYLANQTNIAVNPATCPQAGYLALVNCINVTAEGLILTNNRQGVLLAYTNNSIIRDNNMTNNQYGLCLQNSSDNKLCYNKIADSGCGITLRNSSNNSIYHNDFANNSFPEVSYECVNVWDDGYPSGGNYWSDIGGADLFRGPYQNETGSDGIRDYRLCYPYPSDRYSLMNPWPSGPGLHELNVDLTASTHLPFDNSTLIEAVVTNNGINIEQNVTFSLFINNTIVNSATISTLDPGSFHTIMYSWAPTIEGAFNVTAFAQPMLGEILLANNQRTIFVAVAASLTPPEVRTGVKTDDWIKCTYTISGWPSGTAYPEWLKVEFLSVEGTNATVRVTMHMSDGTEQNATVPVDVVAGGQAFGLSGFVIPANLTVGDVVYMSGYGNVTIAGETAGSYAGASRTVIYASFSQYGTQLTYYWDKQTGVIVEASTTSGTVTGTGKATETNMWQTAHGFPIDPTLIYIVVAVVIVAAAVFLVLRRRKASTEGTTPETDSHE